MGVQLEMGIATAVVMVQILAPANSQTMIAPGSKPESGSMNMKIPAARTAPALLEEMAARFPSRPAVIDADRSVSYASLHQSVSRHATGLRALGVESGSRVGILMGNRLEWLVGYFAAMHLGAEVVGLNTWLTARELAYQLRHAKVEVLLLEPGFLGRDWLAEIDGMRTGDDGGLPAMRTIVCAPAAGHGAVRREVLIDFASLPSLGASAVTDPNSGAGVQPGDTACILYTSGSTSIPKGVPLPHRGLIENMWSIGERMHLEPDDKLWLGVSLFWSFACINAVFTMMTHGGCIVLQHHFSAGPALALIEQQRCTVFYGTPNMVQALVQHPDFKTADLRSLRTGATIGTPEQVRLAVEMGVPELCNVYGLTEAYGNSAVTDAHDPLCLRLTAQGRPLDGVELRVVDPVSRAVLANGEIGEIELRGHLTSGYLDDPVRDAESFSADGFLLTGDLGRLDERGYLQYRGRLKEMVKTGGINVAPAEVEDILAEHPAVESVFVTGVPDERLDEALGAVIVSRPGAQVDAKALEAHCRAALAPYKVPRHFRFVSTDELPQTSTGKLQRNRLVSLFEPIVN